MPHLPGLHHEIVFLEDALCVCIQSICIPFIYDLFCDFFVICVDTQIHHAYRLVCLLLSFNAVQQSDFLQLVQESIISSAKNTISALQQMLLFCSE